MTATACIASSSSTIRFADIWCISTPPGRALIEHRDYPEAIRDALGEAVAASLLLAATIKFDGSCRCNCRARVRCICCSRNAPAALGVRGLARYRERGPAAAGGIAATDRSGNLTVTLETDDGAQRYQGIVPIAGSRLADSLQGVLPEFRAVADASVAACRRDRRLRDAAAAAAVRRAGAGRALRRAICGRIDDAWRRCS